MRTRTRILFAALGLMILGLAAHAAMPGFIKMKNGYFYDAATGQAWVPHGIAYQTWNRPLGVWQTFDQIDYDLDEMKKMGANSVRIDMVWQHIEENGDNQFKWTNYDYFVGACAKRDIRIFALIGYQWPPNWFPDAWYTMHPPAYDSEGIFHPTRWQSDIINYEHPEARAQYAEWFKNVCGRYKNSKAIVAWIVGNESGYLGLWSGLLDGYDPQSEQAFRNWCQAKYGTIAAANAKWGTVYTDFNQVTFPDQYRAYGTEGAVWADAVQWREDSIASFTALGAKAAKTADTNHLISYSTVGMQWGEEDWRYHAEDRGKITAACIATNAPIDFFSVNNYPWSILGHESQNGHWGVSYTKKVAKVPVLYTETGFTSSESMWPGMNEFRQGPLVRNALWESLECGAIGTHIFSWMDRPWITDREKGFGVVYADRNIKPAFWVSRDTYNLMEQVKISDLLMGSKDPTPDIGFLWTAANDSQYNRYECEMQQIAGALERLGYEPNFLNLDDLGSGSYTNFKVIILPRNMRVEDVVPNSTNKTVLDFLRTVVIPRGIHVVASADLPGLQDFNGQPRPAFVNEVKNLFGVDASDIGGFEVPMRRREFVSWYWHPISVKFTSNVVGSLTAGYTYRPDVWKFSDETVATSGGVLWAEMDSLCNKGFEESNTGLPRWEGSWGNVGVRNNWGWQYDGSNMVQMWGDSGLWQSKPAVPFGRYTANAYLRNNSDDPLRGGAYAVVQIEWRDASNILLSTSQSPLMTSPNNGWVRYAVDGIAPANTATGRLVIRQIVGAAPQLMKNPALTQDGPMDWPTDWFFWNAAYSDPDTGTYLSAPNSWAFWWDGGIYQDVTNGFKGGDSVKFGGYLRHPGADPLRNGAKSGVIQLEFYNGTSLLSTASSPAITSNSPVDTWIYSQATATVPASATKLRMTVRCNNYASGDGRFSADDVFLTNQTAGGSVYVDNKQWAPAVVVKNHGAGKSAIFLYSAGDNSPDGNGDGEMDTNPWKNRYDIFGALIRDYFGVQPAIKATGTNAFLCLPEYRTCTNGALLLQVKNYLYDRFAANGVGGSPLTFTIQSSLLNGRTIRAFEQAKIIETNSDGVFTLTLAPDGQEIIYAYNPGTNRTEIVQITDAPAVVHPFGDKVYSIKVKYDGRGATGLKLKAAFMEAGNNGDAITNEIYSILTNTVSMAGETNFWMWIPDYNQTDPDYKSTPDGGKYQFAAWLETAGGVKLAEALPQSTILEWGVRPTNTPPATVTKGQAVSIGLEWEDLYEQLFWQNTPMSRNTSFPSRVAIFRSSKTEAQFAGHLTRANEAANWLENRGYTAGNPLDLMFDNVKANGSFTDNFEDGNYTGWTRAAGCGNWAVVANVTGSVSGAVGYWKCDETTWNGATNQVLDSSGRANHGRAVNGAITTTDARLGRAGYFDGTNDYVEVTNRVTLQANSNLTLSFWIKAQNLGAARINPLDKSYGGEFALTIETNRSVTYYHGSAKTAGKYISWAALPAGSLTNNAWSHVVITRDANTRTLKSYLNNVLKNTYVYALDTNTAPAKTTYAVRIGQGYTGYSLRGVMDEVKVCTSAWTTTDVAKEYSVGVNSKGLRAWRLGNSDNILLYGGTFTNAAVSADIRYNKQDNYFNDAELYFRYKDRANFYKIGIRNYYGFWRIRYMVRANTNIAQQGWICDFPKTNRPVENAWYNLKVEAYGSTNKVYFNGAYVGTFWATNFASGKIGVGGSAQQLGTWEPQKGYYFIDDDEYTFWAPQGQSQDQGRPLNLDFGYLRSFYNSLVLPSVYVMSDIEASNICLWVTNGLYSVIATDGSTAMKNETGALDLGRIERLFGVAPTITTLTNATRVTIGAQEHYVTLDYSPGAQVTVSGTARPWTTLTTGTALGVVSNAASRNAPALIANVVSDNSAAPCKAFCFNYAVDTSSQLVGNSRTLGQRAFEWARGQAYKVRLELKYQVNPAWPDGDIVIAVTNGWLLTGSGTRTLIVNVPTNGIMTGNKLYWAGYVYPWDSGYPWGDHAGFFSTANDGVFTTLGGKGLQIIGGTTNAFGGRDWDLWLAYNTEGEAMTLVYGIKDKGSLVNEDNFNDGDYAGWTVAANPNISWSVTSNALRAAVVSTGGYAYIYRSGLGVGATNITIEYNTRFMNGAREGGAMFRGLVLYVNPQVCGWADNYMNFYTNSTGITNGQWHHVTVNIRDGSPFMRSDLIVDNRIIFVDEPIEVTSFATNTIGLLSPYSAGYAEWDNVRIADEQYSFVTTGVSGVYVPTNATTPFYAFVPDYDPAMWEHEGTTLGGRYEWFAYLRGAGVQSVKDTAVYFGPRIMDEDTNFPSLFNPGKTVYLPVEWEQLPNVPAKLYVALQEVWSGNIYATNIVTVSSASGSALVPVQVPEETPSGAGFTWAAYTYPTNSPDPWNGRIGLDDTFRYGRDGIALKAETTVIVSPVVGGDFVAYRDAGLPVGCDVYTWQGSAATFDGNYAGGTPPEGSKCFRTDSSSWAGWGIFSITGAVDMTEYRDGFLRFWVRSTTTLKLDLEDWAGVKSTKYIPTTSNAWKEIVIPISDFTTVNKASMKGLFEITAETATTFYIDHIRWTKGIVKIYSDAGIPAGSDVFTWSGGAAAFNGHYTDGAAPEGAECFLTTGATWAGWGVVKTNGVMDFSLYTNGYVSFWARSAAGLKIEIEAPQGTTKTAYIGSTTGAWKEFSLPLSAFGGFNCAQVYSPFKVTSTNGTTFLVDDVRWEKGTNAVPSEKKETFFSDAGIPAGADVFVWWANSYWTHLSDGVADGGFESSAVGSFPNSGFWSFTNAGAGAGALCNVTSLYTGAKGLREKTGTDGTAWWASTFQEIEGYAGDIYSGQVYVRQPSGSPWVAGSMAYLRLQFLDAWHQVLTNVVSATKVTAAGQAWTLCSIPNTTAPLFTRFVRCELVVQKPSGTAGISEADFDVGWCGQYNSFNGQFTEDPVTPEGTRCFRSYCVYWSGWGIFYTNTTTTNLSQYANGYLKFWYKSSSYTKVEIQSVWNGVTNKAAYPSAGWFGPTYNGQGQVVWQQKCVPISYFAGVDLAHIKSPFMVTDPTYDHAFYVDDVRWTMSP